jgi:hypothetical protein
MRLLSLTLALTGLASVVFVVAASARTQSSTDTRPSLHACVVASGSHKGDVTIINALYKCPSGEFAIRLVRYPGNAGPTGPAGPVGPVGPIGAAGANGPQGSTGATGATGATGSSGPSGATGATGAGATGATGATGPSGPQGPVGATGAAGPSGPSGSQGPAGATGATGVSGPSGPQGPVGAAGATGPTGPTGAAGAQSVSGDVVFVDALDTTGYAGTAGSQNVYVSAGEAASPVPIAGTLRNFSAHAGSSVASAGVTLTVMKNGSATSVTCTIPNAGSSCTDTSDTVALATSDVIAVKIQNGSGTFVRDVSWTAQLG